MDKLGFFIFYDDYYIILMYMGRIMYDVDNILRNKKHIVFTAFFPTCDHRPHKVYYVDNSQSSLTHGHFFS